MLYAQNGDRFVTIDSVASLRLVYVSLLSGGVRLNARDQPLGRLSPSAPRNRQLRQQDGTSPPASTDAALFHATESAGTGWETRERQGREAARPRC